MKKIFISFSSKQTSEAEEICNFLEKNNISCFISTRDLVAGEEYAAQLIQNIDSADAVLLILTPDSNESPHVLREVEYAVSHRTPILVYSLIETTLSKSMEYFLMTHQWITPNGDREQKLLYSIEHLATNESKDASSSKVEPSNDIPNSSVNNKKTPVILTAVIAFFLIAVIIIALLLYNLTNKINNIQSQTSNIESENIESENANKKTETIEEKIDDKKENTEEIPEEKNEAPIENLPFSLGDSIFLGNYNDLPIEWRVIKINDDGTMMLISKYILCLKTFDAAEGGEYNFYEGVDYWSYDNHIIDDNDLCIKVRGNNDWEVSNIRTWLNADTEVVNYKDQAPSKKAVGDNSYNIEAGFLYSFTDEEKDALVPVKHGNTDDKVFLLSIKELELLKTAGIPIYTAPTKEALTKNEASYYYKSFSETYHTENYYWWLRDSESEKANEGTIVVTEVEEDYEYYPASVGASGYGVRPVICVKGNSDAITKLF